MEVSEYIPKEMTRLILLCLLQLTTFVSAGTYIKAETHPHQRPVSMNERGVPVTGQHYLVIQIKACESAILFLSEKYSTRVNDRFFLIVLGAKDNTGTINVVMDSCLQRCLRPSWTIPGDLLDCSTFKPFWISWDHRGGLTIGGGSVIGQHPLIAARSPQPFLINYLFLMGKNNNAEWKFFIDSPPKFIFPRPNGGSVIEIPENTDVRKVVFEMKASDPDKDLVVFAVTGRYASTFRCAGSSVLLQKKLDFETQPMYNIQIIANDGFHTVFTHLTVIVTDVNDNSPKINVLQPIVIPEQLPVGTMIGLVTSAHDEDTHDKLTYSVRGSNSKYFSMDPHTGAIYVEKVIDLEEMKLESFVVNVTLVVTDAAGHMVERIFNVTITDINDNPPRFSRNNYIVSVNESGGETQLVTFSVTDADPDSDGDMILSLPDKDDIFFLHGFTLLVNSSLLDYDSTPPCQQRRRVIVLARDGVKEMVQNTATATVTVNVLPVNEHTPVWTDSDNGTLLSVTVSVTGQTGHLATTLTATDRDAGEDGHVKYRLVSITTATDCEMNGTFSVDAETGRIGFPSSIDICANFTAHYRLHVQAYDLGTPSRYVDGLKDVTVKTEGTESQTQKSPQENNRPKSKLTTLNSGKINKGAVNISSDSSVTHANHSENVYSGTGRAKNQTDIAKYPDMSAAARDEHDFQPKKIDFCESKIGVILLQSMIAVLGGCVILTSCFIAYSKTRLGRVYPASLECHDCTYSPQTPPLTTTEGNFKSVL